MSTQRLWVMAVLSTLIFISSSFTPSISAIIYVSPNGNNSNSGVSWNFPKLSITEALNRSVSGDEIWVAAGLYMERITLKAGVQLYGGFNGTETERGQRNWKANVTVLDGSQGGTVVTVASGATTSTSIDGFTICNGKDSNGIYCSSASPTISNNIIRGNSGSSGSAVYCYNSNAVICGNIIIGNASHTSYGAVYCSSSQAIIRNNTIIGNTCAIYCYSSSPQIDNNIIAFNGDAIKNTSSTPLVRYNCFYENGPYAGPSTTDENGNINADPKITSTRYGDVHLQPGSPCIDAGDDSLTSGVSDIDGQQRIQGSHIDIGADEFDGNQAVYNPTIIRVSQEGLDTNDGSSWTLAKKTIQAAINQVTPAGGEVWVKAGIYKEPVTLNAYVYLYGGFNGTEDDRALRNHAANVTVIDGQQQTSTVSAYSGYLCSSIDGFTICNGKSATKGGGVYCQYGTPLIANNSIIGNNATSGGGIFCSNSSPVIINNVIRSNGAIEAGGGIYCFSSYAWIANNTILGNSAGIYISQSSPTIKNNIITDNTSGIYHSSVSPLSPELDNNCVYGNPSGDYIDITSGAGDISLDPRLASSTLGNPHIQPDSPCIDAGDDSVIQADWLDMDGQQRIQGSHVDIGADESDGTVRDVQPQVIRVSTEGLDTNDGSSWDAPRKTIQAAINALSPYGGEVWVKVGVYNERLSVPSYIRLFGHFNGTETDKSQRSASTQASIIDGQNGGVVVAMYGGGTSSAIDGFTIRNGKADVGAGIYCAYSSPVISNNILTTVGIGCYYSSPSIVNNTITACTTIGIHCTHSSPKISNNIIAWNMVGIRNNGTGVPMLSHNCVYGNANGNYKAIAPGVTDISMDPKLASSALGNLYIQPDSPCVDAGDDSAVQSDWLDIDGQQRIQGSHVDIGADESDGTAWDVQAQVIRVSTEGLDTNDGSSWDAPRKTIQAAINALSPTGGEVWVKAGTYNEKITLKMYAYLYGGFSGIETSKEQRNWKTNQTILDGQQTGTVVTASGTGHLICAIDGFVIRNGRSTSTGGGISCSYASPIIANNVITANLSGYDTSASTGFGGGIYCYYASPLIKNNTITANTSAYNGFGGGIACVQSAPTIINNFISGNGALHTPGSGGGIACKDSSPVIVNNTIIRNAAYSGGGVTCEGTSNARIANNIIAWNTSGVSTSNTNSITFTGNCVYGNRDGDYPGAIHPVESDGNISLDPRLASSTLGNPHIQPDSPCIDAGDDSVIQADWLDMDGQQRIQGSHVDIGADESDGTVWDVQPQIIRVSTEGLDTNDGSSWDAPRKTIQAAINALSPTGGEVWVKAGTYNEKITLKMYAYLYGGFDGTETSKDQRAWKANRTIIDGQQTGSVVTASGTGHLISGIDGFVVKNGKAVNGGGIVCSYSSVCITNNEIADNIGTPGAGIFCYYSSSEIIDNTLTGNYYYPDYTYPDVHGGGIYCGYSNPLISRNAILRSKHPQYTDFSNGIYCFASRPTIVNNIIAISSGSGIHCSGSSPAIINNTIAHHRYIGIYIAANLQNRYQSEPTIVNNIVAYNETGISKDSIYQYSNPTLVKNCVYSNTRQNYFNLQPGPTDIQVDPKFVDAAGYDYHLWVDSPCIDAGTDISGTIDLSDIDKQPRILGARTDIGADEYGPALPSLTFTPDGGSYVPPKSITISCPEPGVRIYYTTNGKNPTEGDLVADGPVTLTYSTLLKARAYKDGFAPSVVKSAYYNLGTNPPAGALAININDTWTNSTSVNLTISTTTVPYRMAFSNDNINFSWETYVPYKQWTLTGGDGLKNVYLKLQDGGGTIILEAQDDIMLDTTAPRGLISINEGASFTNSPQVLLTVFSTDSGCGTAHMRFSNDGQNWSVWEPYSYLKEWVLSSGDGTKTVYVRFRDILGNETQSISNTIMLDAEAPSGSVVINNGDAYTGATNVTLTLTGADNGSGVSQMRFKNNSANWSEWVDFASTYQWTLPPAIGTQTVSAQFKDSSGYVSSACSDSIYLTPAMTIGEARNLPSGSIVFVTGVVTSTSIDAPGLWIESADRSSAIRILPDWTADRGDVVSAAGVISWDNGVPVLKNAESKGLIAGTLLPALGTTNAAIASDKQETLTYTGLNPVGLLVTTWGKVKRVDALNNKFYIDDGSALCDGTGTISDPVTGLRIEYGQGIIPPASGETVRVTGIRLIRKITLEADSIVNGETRLKGETLYLPVILMRDQADISRFVQ